MAIYAWYYLCNDGKGEYRRTEAQYGQMSSGKFIEFNGKNYLIEKNYSVNEELAKRYIDIGINYFINGRQMEFVFLSFEAQDRGDAIYSQTDGFVEVREGQLTEWNPALHIVYTKYINTLFDDYH